jgi:hypothetical protein
MLTATLLTIVKLGNNTDVPQLMRGLRKCSIKKRKN